MQTGEFPKDYTTNKTYWVVEGFSEQINKKVYPHQGWSLTEWKTKISDTYETFQEAKSAISCGYLRDMIKSQKIKDIVFFQITIEQEIKQKKTVIAVKADGEVDSDYEEEIYNSASGVIRAGDYLFVEIQGGGSMNYCRVETIRADKMHLWIINGGWALIVNIQGDPIVDITTTNLGNGRKPVNILKVGHYPEFDAKDYRKQYDHYLAETRELI